MGVSGMAAAMATRTRTRFALVVLALVLIAACIDAGLMWRAHRDNASIASGETIPAAEGQTAELRFARAYAQAASEPGEAALNAYRALQADTRLGQAARFNSANLLVRQAIRIQQSEQPGQAIALLELAKEIYRDVLRENPGHWDARYNLERAQRLLPDPEEVDNEPPESARNRERAATTMRGFSPGLP